MRRRKIRKPPTPRKKPKVKLPPDGIDLESERGHEILDFVIDQCGFMLRKFQVVKETMVKFNLSRAQCYRYYDSAWETIRANRMVDHEVHVDRAVTTLEKIVSMSVKDKQTFAAMQAMDRIALLTGIKNPVSDQGMALTQKVDDDLSDAELQAIVGRRAKRAGAGGSGSGPAAPPASGS